jgi:pyruvate,orthophosphate dikinase
MVFGNVGESSDAGVAFTLAPGTGARVIYGDYLPDAQDEGVVAGIRNTLALIAMNETDPASYVERMDIRYRWEERYLDLCHIEFTVERR